MLNAVGGTGHISTTRNRRHKVRYETDRGMIEENTHTFVAWMEVVRGFRITFEFFQFSWCQNQARSGLLPGLNVPRRPKGIIFWFSFKGFTFARQRTMIGLNTFIKWPRKYVIILIWCHLAIGTSNCRSCNFFHGPNQALRSERYLVERVGYPPQRSQTAMTMVRQATVKPICD